MKKNFLLVSVFFLFQGMAFSQNGTIKGLVSDKTENNPLPGATVSLLAQADSTLVKSTTTNSTGSFEFNNVEAGSFIVTITTIGYQQYVNFLKFTDTLRDLGNMQMQIQGTDLFRDVKNYVPGYLQILSFDLPANAQPLRLPWKRSIHTVRLTP